MPLWVQFTSWLGLVALMACIMAFVLVGRAYIASAESRARTIANLVEDVGTWASKYKGAWVRSEAANPAAVGSFLETVTPDSVEPLPAQFTAGAWRLAVQQGTFHRKNPALIQRELSEITNASGQPAKFRITSDKYMNRDNAPNRFEIGAIEEIRETGAKEMTEIKGNELRFARRLTVTANCMACHDTPEKAPLAVRALYPDPKQGYGYQLGDVAGVISVSVPIIESGSGSIFGSLGGAAATSIFGFLASLAGMLWFVKRSVIRPVHQLSKFAGEMSQGDLADLKAATLRLNADYDTSRNEINMLRVAVQRLLRSLHVQRRRN
jgi:HAMP domain-containing protein